MRNPLTAGEVLGGRYRIVSLLGKGGMSTVYLAEDLKLKGKKWAIKEIFQHSSLEVQSFIDEAEILTRVNHAHLPNIVDYFPPDDAGYGYLVVDYVEGGTLSERFERSGRKLPVRDVIRYAIQICEAFQYLHHHFPHPVVYRDLKPSNVMIDGQNNVRLIDFGIARNYKAGNPADTVRIGTVGFAAPEQFENRQTDQRTDLYTLGALLYFLATGGQYYCIRQQPLAAGEFDLPEGMDRLINRLLMHAPEERFANALEVLEHLRRLEQAQIPDFRQAFRSGAGVPPDSIPKKLVLTGSLYSGAGATFIAVSVGRMLSRYGIEHAVVEFPLNEPELYYLLNGDSRAPNPYYFLSDRVVRENDIEAAPVWRDGFTEWYPLHPLSRMEQWDSHLTLSMLYRIKAPIVLVDVSDRWNHPAMDDLIRHADELWLVAGPFPDKIRTPQAASIVEKLHRLKSGGKRVLIIANRQTEALKKRSWASALPFDPVCCVPNIPLEQMVDAAWKGELVQDRKDIADWIAGSMTPWLESWIPAIRSGRRKAMARKGFWQRWMTGREGCRS